jgi:hypothetical protein
MSLRRAVVVGPVLLLVALGGSCVIEERLVASYGLRISPVDISTAVSELQVTLRGGPENLAPDEVVVATMAELRLATFPELDAVPFDVTVSEAVVVPDSHPSKQLTLRPRQLLEARWYVLWLEHLPAQVLSGAAAPTSPPAGVPGVVGVRFRPDSFPVVSGVNACPGGLNALATITFSEPVELAGPATGKSIHWESLILISGPDGACATPQPWTQGTLTGVNFQCGIQGAGPWRFSLQAGLAGSTGEPLRLYPDGAPPAEIPLHRSTSTGCFTTPP